MTANYKTYEFKGKTIEDAIKKGLKELNQSRDNVKIDVISEGSQGLFGLVGAKSACVRISVPQTELDEISDKVKKLLQLMDIEANIKANKKDDGRIYLNIESDDAGIIIGKRGETLNALQYISNLIINHNRDEKLKIVLDLEDYRKKREKTLSQLARRIAQKARKTGKSIALEPMNAQERRIIHIALSEMDDIETHSSGSGRFRKVIISPKKTQNSNRKEVKTGS